MFQSNASTHLYSPNHCHDRQERRDSWSSSVSIRWSKLMLNLTPTLLKLQQLPRPTVTELHAAEPHVQPHVQPLCARPFGLYDATSH